LRLVQAFQFAVSGLSYVCGVDGVGVVRTKDEQGEVRTTNWKRWEDGPGRPIAKLDYFNTRMAR
jgi:hypothetical protein